MRRLPLSYVFCLFLIITAIPLHAEIDSQYTAQLEQLTTKLKVHGFTDDELGTLFSNSRAKLYPPIVEKSGKGLDYFHRRFGLLTRKSIERGQSILSENKEMLNRIEETFGVDKEVILSVLRVETDFGRITGRYLVFNSLLSMVLIKWDITAKTWEEFPPQQKWFAFGETMAHVKYLETKGKVRCKSENGKIKYMLA